MNRLTTLIIGAVLAVVLLGLGLFVGLPSFTRWNERNEKDQARTQALADANNQVQVTAIQIQNQAQQIQVTEQQAQIRYQTAVGIRKAQDEISSTLTPLYVQFEMVDALKEIAKSGQNNTVVYIPSGANGIPLVSGTGASVGVPR